MPKVPDQLSWRQCWHKHPGEPKDGEIVRGREEYKFKFPMPNPRLFKASSDKEKMKNEEGKVNQVSLQNVCQGIF